MNTSSIDLLMLEEPHNATNMLKPVKQSCSENNNNSYAVNNTANNNAVGATAAGPAVASSSMRTTRSKAKANKQMDKTAKSGPKNDETPNG